MDSIALLSRSLHLSLNIILERFYATTVFVTLILSLKITDLSSYFLTNEASSSLAKYIKAKPLFYPNLDRGNLIPITGLMVSKCLWIISLVRVL